jgi:hypothetical protein
MSCIITQFFFYNPGAAEDLRILLVKGKVAVIGFGIAMCTPCKELAQTIKKLKNLYGEEVSLT